MASKNNCNISTLSTKRLTLRPLTTDDRNWIYELYSNPTVTAGFGRDAFSDNELKEKSDQLLGPWARGGFSQFLVIDKTSNEIVGIGGIRPTDKRNVGEIGYVFLPKWWGRGMATEAVQAWTKWGFKYLQLDKIIANSSKNPASVCVLEKNGYEVTNEDGHSKSFELTRS